MARHESDREDLMREATALTRRVELSVENFPDPVVAGFRDSAGWVSFYFGQDPTYTFDAERRLRRAFAGGNLYRTQGTTLARMIRERTPEATHLVRSDLPPDELTAFLQEMRSRLCRLDAALGEGHFELRQCVSPDGEWGRSNWLLDVREAIAAILSQPDALAPAIVRR